jgi:hypothetical protein
MHVGVAHHGDERRRRFPTIARWAKRRADPAASTGQKI